MLYPTVLRCSTVFPPIITVYAYIVKVSHDHVLLVRMCNNLMHMWHHVTNHLIISNDKDSNSEIRIKLRVRNTMHLGADQGMSPEPLEIELTRIAANRMERRRLLSEKVMDTIQDEIFCLAGFTYSQQIAEKAN
jgi:hypothetical protein